MNEIRLDPQGEVDDIVITAPTLFRMERLADGTWWVCCYRGNERTSFYISGCHRVNCHIQDNELDCVVKK